MKKILSSIQSFWKRLWKKAPVVNSADGAIDLDAIERSLDEDLLKISVDQKLLIGHVEDYISTYGSYYQRVGQAHGKGGSRDFNIRRTATAHSTIITNRVVSALQGGVDSLKWTIGEMDKRLGVLTGDGTKYNTERKRLEQLRGDENGSFSSTNAALLLFAGFVMVVADMVVSLNLVSYLGIGNADNDASLLDLVSDTDIVLFASGVAFCTVLVKLLYDEYVNSKMGYRQLQLKRIMEEQPGVNKWLIYGGQIAKFGVKMLILTGLLVMLYFMARYRAYFIIEEVGVNRLNAIQKAFGVDDVKQVLMYCFIGVTVVIPVISGIAISAGLKIVGNRRHLKRAVEDEERNRKNIDQYVSELEEKRNLYHRLGRYRAEWNKTSEKIRLTAELFEERYNQGFRLEYRTKFGNDIYTIIEEYRNELVNATFSNRINSKKNEGLN